MKTRAIIANNIDPNSPETSHVVIATPLDDPAIRHLLNSACEGDGAFYVPTTDAWAVLDRRADQVSIRIERLCDGAITVLLETSCPAVAGSLSQATLLVQSDADWPQIFSMLRAREELPVILGPKMVD